MNAIKSTPDTPVTPTFFNRELSWLEFNSRVLEEALAPATPLLERLKFLSIFSANLDEFFMVRVAGLKKILEEGLDDYEAPDRLSSFEVLQRVRERTCKLLQIQYDCLQRQVLPQLDAKSVRIVRLKDLGDLERATLNTYYVEHIFPVLTPLAVDPAHPFPFMANLALYLVVTLRGPDDTASTRDPLLGLVEIPSILPRLIPVLDAQRPHTYILIEDLVATHLESLFLGLKFEGCYAMRVTRNLDYTLLENEVVDLIKSIQKEVANLQHRTAVRLEAADDVPDAVLKRVQNVLALDDSDVYRIKGPLVLNGLMPLCSLPLPELKDPPFNPRLPECLAGSDDIFSLISARDLLVHHPYESFYAVVDFLNAAATDPEVLAIKQTLYRTSGDSPIIDALMTAAQNGKHVTAVIELKARFDETNNIVWANRLERAGVNVVFGFIGFKTHAKATLVVRREKGRLRRYVHVSTGNYNSSTAKIYTDIGMFTAAEDFGEDVSALFNLLTGFNVLTGEHKLRRDRASLPAFRALCLAPFMMQKTIIDLIDREITHQKQHGNGHITAKMNALVERNIIEKLYEASRAGVTIKLIVRGICCLKPGIPGLSDHIEVISIVDRFLEHSRVFVFHNKGQEDVFVSSADWMPRNMLRRVEIMWPIRDPRLKKRLTQEVLSTCWADNVKARVLQSDGTYILRRPAKNEEIVRSQARFIDLARKEGVKSLPYDVAIHHDRGHRQGRRPVAGQGQGRRGKT